MGLPRFSDSPTFVLTADQDWAPVWAAQALLDLVRAEQLPLHIFRTGPCPALDEAVRDGTISQGWHPNFLAGSSHGAEVGEVIAYMQRHFPGVRTVRTHCFYEDTRTWQRLVDAEIVADSQLVTRYQPGLVPLVHWTGIVRFPLFYEDDIFLRDFAPKLSLEPIKRRLFAPGLKVLNVHPVFYACNTPSIEHYDENRGQVFGSSAPAEGAVWSGRGSANVLAEMIGLVHQRGHSFASFERVVDRALDGLRSND